MSKLEKIKAELNYNEPTPFCCEVALSSGYDVSPQQVHTVMYNLGLIDWQGEPTYKATMLGLPNSNKVTTLIGTVAEASYNIQSNYDCMMYAQYLRSSTEPHSQGYEEATDTIQVNTHNINSWLTAYNEAYSKLLIIINN